MADRTIIVTGANSYAGGLLVGALLSQPGIQVITLHTSEESVATQPADVTDRLVVDLRRKIGEPARSIIRSADRVFHLAWVRGFDRADVERQNAAMISNLADAMADPTGLIFFSTAAAGPDAPSIYGAVKFAVEHQVREIDGSVLTVGLVTGTPPRTAYRTIEAMVRKLPLRIRFDGSFRFYSDSEENFAQACMSFLGDLPAATYAVFPPEGESSNAFLRPIEAANPRPRLPLWLPSGLILACTRLFGRLGLMPRGLGERLMALLYSDTARLAKMTRLP